MKKTACLFFACAPFCLAACATAPRPYPTPGDTERQELACIACLAATSSHQGPSQTFSPTATFPPPPATPTDTPTPFIPFVVPAAVENLNLRINPGYLFSVLRVLRQGTLLRIFGQSPGGEWFYAAAPDGAEGWVFGILLEADARLPEVPIRAPQDVQTLSGMVLDANGIPIQGVVFNVSKGTGPKAPTNTVVTDSSGTFYSFMPPDSSGMWTVAYAAIACRSNVWKPGGCDSYLDGYRGSVVPPSIDVRLPSTELIRFTWT
jgi:hypothetical protein